MKKLCLLSALLFACAPSKEVAPALEGEGYENSCYSMLNTDWYYSCFNSDLRGTVESLGLIWSLPKESNDYFAVTTKAIAFNGKIYIYTIYDPTKELNAGVVVHEITHAVEFTGWEREQAAYFAQVSYLFTLALMEELNIKYEY